MNDNSAALAGPIVEELKRQEAARFARSGKRVRAKNKKGARHDVNPVGAKRFKKEFKASQGRRPTRAEILVVCGPRNPNQPENNK